MSCRRVDYTGRRFGKLLVIGIYEKPKNKNTIFKCVCDCGKEIIRCGGNLIDSKSCGCYRSNFIDSNRLTKTCSNCRLEKTISSFSKNSNRKDGRSQYCYECKVDLDIKYRPRYKDFRTNYTRCRRKNDVNFRLSANLRGRINSALKHNNNRKSSNTTKLIGCSVRFLKKYLKSKFYPQKLPNGIRLMTWDNYGKYGWHVDHVIPCDKFDLSKPEEQRKCFHYTNLQPLWARDNIIKSNKIL